MNPEDYQSPAENQPLASQTPSEFGSPKFAHLGSPRSLEPQEVVGRISAAPLPPKEPERPSLSFKYVKTHTLGSTPGAYMLYGAILVIIIVSVMASLTQGILLLKDKLFSGASHISSEQISQTTLPADQSEPRGSDDGKVAEGDIFNFQPLYKVANADQISNLGVTAKGYYVADLKTGERIMAKNSTEAFPIASISKLMTAVIAYEKMDLQQVVVVSRDSYNTYGAQGELLPGERIKLGDLLYPLLMESSNDGAEVIAESYGRENFISEMNKKAALLGMTDTYYEDPSGLNPKNVSSSEDLFKLLKYIKEKAPVLYDMTRVREFAILKHKWFNQNRFLNTEYFTGGKNGYIDESRWTTASTFDITLAKGGKRSIAIVLLKSENREGDAQKLIKFMQKNVFFTETGNF